MMMWLVCSLLPPRRGRLLQSELILYSSGSGLDLLVQRCVSRLAVRGTALTGVGDGEQLSGATKIGATELSSKYSSATGLYG